MKQKKIVIIAILAVIVLIIIFTNQKPIEEEKNYCSEESRNVDACIEIYQPVCGYLEVQCITTPCPPTTQSFSNSCFACMNENVLYWINGECQE